MDNKIKKFTFWELIGKEKYKIEIPTIQRDYIQASSLAKKRNIPDKFIDNLFEAIKNNKKCDLGFIYGSIVVDKSKKNDNVVNQAVNNDENYKKLHILDGQQRLTTLFLLHYYLSLNEKISENNKKFLKNFSYSTRSATRDFCDRLLGQKNINQKFPIKEQIKKCNWFFSFWEEDTTISSMLNMLEIIQEKFKETDEKNFNVLIEEKKIFFNFLDMGQFNLKDELYLKMNSRGKMLTDFELFKSKIIDDLKNIDSDTTTKFDNVWQNMFWEKVKLTEEEKKKDDEKYNENLIDSFDKSIYNFFENVTFLLCIDKIEEYNSEQKKDLKNFKLLNFIDFLYKEKKGKEDYIKSYLEKIIKLLCNIEKFLNNDSEFSKYKNIFSKSLQSRKDDDLEKNAKTITLPELVEFYAFIIFLLKCNKEDYEKLRKWYRICKNLIHNTLIDNIKDLHKYLQEIEELSKNINDNDIYKYFSEIKEENINIKYFDTEQIKEEILKSKIILKDNIDSNILEKNLIEAENHSFFDGKIGFILEFSKEGNKYSLEKFNNYFDKLSILFNIEKENIHSTFCRALLSCGNYTIPIGHRYSFGLFEQNIRSKKDTWHKVFDSGNSGNRKYLLDLLKKIDIKENNNKEKTIEDSLKNIIKNYENEKEKEYSKVKKEEHSKIKNWIYWLIVKPEIIEQTKQKEFRIDEDKEEQTIYLCRGSGPSWSKKYELFSFAFYLYYKEKTDKKEIQYIESNGKDFNGPYICIEKKFNNNKTICFNLFYISNKKYFFLFVSKNKLPDNFNEEGDNISNNIQDIKNNKIYKAQLKAQSYNPGFEELKEILTPIEEIKDDNIEVKLEELQENIENMIYRKSN